MKLFVAGMAHETNTFSPLPTSKRAFEEMMIRPKTGQGMDRIGDAFGYKDFIRMGEQSQMQVAKSLFCFAQPSAPTVQKDYEELRDEILADLKAAMPVDMVLLMLHGAQMAQGYDDCEGDIIERVRKIVGPEVAIGVELDLHANVTKAMIDNSTVLMVCKEYPHIDFDKRAEQIFDLCLRAQRGEIKPVMYKFNVPMLGAFPTTREPLRSFVDETAAMEGKDGILSVSLVHGFSWSDFPEMGASVVVVADGDMGKAKALAETLGKRFFNMRKQIESPRLDIDEALDQALAEPKGPVVMADRSDNAGGGAAGDSTYVLEAILKRGIKNVALSMIWDPMAVQSCFDAGVGATIDLRIGGKTGKFSGNPVDVTAKITALAENPRQFMFGAVAPLGRSAAIQFDGIDVVLNSIRQQTFSPEAFSELGIDPKSRKILVVKSTQHFHACFAPIASKIIYVGAPGTLSTNYLQFPYKRMPRPMAPIDKVSL
ncbi:MAG: M81 family metallopeptidase [Alphaproteobacteria bacterium]|nr:M81 family metallopeptidase [Alphaproteobacteria bacterium]